MTATCATSVSKSALSPLGSERERIRDRHHSLAKSEARGHPPLNDWSPSTLSILRADPAFKNLVAYYRRIEG